MERAVMWWDFGALTLAASVMALLVAASAPRAATILGDGAEGPWAGYVRAADAALARGEIGAAERASQQAYAAALGNRGWEGMVAVGDVYRRIGGASNTRHHATGKARDAYLAALFRARQQESLPGVFRTAEAFAALGDREVVGMCIRVAEIVAARVADAQAREEARTSVERMASRLLSLEAQKSN